MSNASERVPSYRCKKVNGYRYGCVSLPDGLGGRRDLLLGIFGTKASREEYARVIAEWEAAGRRVASATTARDLTISELLVAYWEHAKKYYVKEGLPTSEQETIRQALCYVERLYGRTAAREFGPLALKAIRQEMVQHPITRRYKVTDPETGERRWQERVIRHGLSRRYINKQIGRIKRTFAWAVEEELVPVSVYQALACVKGLKKGKSDAREKPRIKPVPDAFVEAVLPLVPETIRAMIQVQRLCGCRPQDIINMRAVDIDVSAGEVWEYRPSRYKTQHHNDDDIPDLERVVYIGPRAQELIRPLLPLNVSDHIFSPIRSEQARYAERRQRRKTKLWSSHVAYQERQRQSRRRVSLHDRYDVAAYRRSIRRACIRAGVPVWSPLQLRHSRGTEIRKRYGLEAAQAVLGHAELGVTQVYAEVDREIARKVAAEIG
jgi:integrase